MSDIKKMASDDEQIEEMHTQQTTVSRYENDPLAAYAHIDSAKLLRKMDIRLIPMLALLYLLSFLDRKTSQNKLYRCRTDSSSQEATSATQMWKAFPRTLVSPRRSTTCA